MAGLRGDFNEHAYEIRSELAHVSTHMKVARAQLGRGECSKAIKTLAGARQHMGAANLAVKYAGMTKEKNALRSYWNDYDLVQGRALRACVCAPRRRKTKKRSR